MENKSPFALKSAILVLAMSALLIGCGGDSSSPPPTNNALTLSDGTLKVKAGNIRNLQLASTNASAVAIYSIVTQPAEGTATITDGKLTYTAGSIDGTFTIVVKVLDGTETATATITVTVANSIPEINNALISMPTAANPTFQVSATDADAGDNLTFSIVSHPDNTVNAAIDPVTGVITFTDFASFLTASSLVVGVSDGEASNSATISISSIDDITANAMSFKNMFYRVTNPNTKNSQIVHYDYQTKVQTVIKTNVILGDRVFIMSGNKVGDKITYVAREYGIFHDPSASFETRTGIDSRGRNFQYNFYANHILKRFDTTNNTGTESVIFEGSLAKLGVNLYSNLGIRVIDSTVDLLLNEVDINNSYVRLNAYDRLADVLQGENPKAKTFVPLTVRLSDSAMTQGRPLAIIKDATSGLTNGVLINFVAPHIRTETYPIGNINKKRLQSCDAALANCTDIANGAGEFFLLAKNTAHVYLTKTGSRTIYAYDKVASRITAVTGVEYPALFTPAHHLMNTGGYGSNLNFFTSLADMRTSLSEGNTSFIAINYDLDTDSPIGTFLRRDFLMYKHAQVLKITGTTGTRVFDNGDGIDHMNDSTGTDPTLGEHISLSAVKDGKLFLELVTYTGSAELGGTCTPGPIGDNCTNLRQGMIDTTSGPFPKTDVDTELGALVGLRFLRGNRIPPVAVGNYIYIAMWDPTSDPGSFSGKKTYNVYKVPFANPVLPSPLAQGRMFFERTAFRSSGVYEGNVLLWNALTSEVTNATTGELLGLDTDIGGENAIVNVIAKGSTNILAGTGGIFGIRMFLGHGGTRFLTAGESAVPGSLKNVNQITGNWIID